MNDYTVLSERPGYWPGVSGDRLNVWVNGQLVHSHPFTEQKTFTKILIVETTVGANKAIGVLLVEGTRNA